jgi:uncharacterized protein (TIGR03435 family)
LVSKRSHYPLHTHKRSGLLAAPPEEDWAIQRPRHIFPQKKRNRSTAGLVGPVVRTNSWLAVAAVVAASHVPAARAQTAGAAFDVASVRANKSGPRDTNIKVLPNGVNLVNVPLRAIIQLAYGIQQPSGLAGVPNWASDERFDISAKSDAIASRDQLRAMLQALLADRFKLAAHGEMRERPIYALTRAHPNDTPGPSLRPSTAVCDNAGQTKRCGPRPGGRGKIILVGSPMSQLASVLSLALGRMVVDRTGLTGNYDVELSYAQDGPSATPDAGGPSLFTALREQLRLQLKPERERVDVLVVDSIGRPDDN